MKPSLSANFAGLLAGLAAAVGYGLVPLFTLHINGTAPVEADRMGDVVILFYRFLFASAIIGGIMLVRGQSFRISLKELGTLLLLAYLSDASALFNIAGFQYISSGAATTIRFFYPVFTTLIMLVFYKEPRRWSTIIAMLMAVVGVVVLSLKGDAHAEIEGIVFEILSAVCMAFYLVYVSRSRVKDMNGLKLTFYVLFIGALIFGGRAFQEGSFEPITTPTQWYNLLLAAVICTAATNLSLVFAVKKVGSTVTAVLGALEPLTAVAVGALCFAENITLYTLLGIAIILPAVLIIIISQRKQAT
ncbi:MAG: DMT family transporter [Bacteroidales bacterium]|nr:DMT family transporter [Bacteroidales bacterium]